jgi:hypothetical protein
VLNNTSWQITGKSCPIARNEPAASMWMRAVYGDDLDLAPKTALTPRPAHRGLSAAFTPVLADR